MALFPTHHMLTQGSLHYRLATLGYQKRNTYGVVPHKPYPNPGKPTLSFGNPGLSKVQRLQR